MLAQQALAHGHNIGLVLFTELLPRRRVPQVRGPLNKHNAKLSRFICAIDILPGLPLGILGVAGFFTVILCAANFAGGEATGPP